MLEEAEKNAAVDKSKKSLVNIIYEYDALLGKAEKMMLASDFVGITNENTRNYFTKVITTMKSNYKKNQFTRISTDLVENLTSSYDVLLFDFIQTKLSKRGKSSSSVIDITDDAIDV